VVVVHDGLSHGQPVPFECPALRQHAQHHDPVPGYDTGRWLAGFAPVAGTGLTVIVQTRDLERQGTVTILFEVGGLLAVCGLAGLAMAWLSRRPR
jgi:hypothetical protein